MLYLLDHNYNSNSKLPWKKLGLNLEPWKILFFSSSCPLVHGMKRDKLCVEIAHKNVCLFYFAAL